MTSAMAYFASQRQQIADYAIFFAIISLKPSRNCRSIITNSLLTLAFDRSSIPHPYKQIRNDGDEPKHDNMRGLTFVKNLIKQANAY